MNLVKQHQSNLARTRRKFQTRAKFSTAIFRRFAVLAFTVSSFLFFTACGDSASDRAEQVGGVTARQIIENPSAYVGKTVTVSGDVEEIYGPRAFNMDSGLSIGELLVVGREPFPQIPEAGNRGYVINDVATVTGTVRMFVTADLEREVGWDLTPEIEAEFNGKPVLIVQKVQFRPGAGNTASRSNAEMNQSMANNSVQPTAGNNANQTPTGNNAGQTSAGGDVTDVLTIVTAADATPLVGRRVQLSNVKVQKVIGDRAFYVGPNENQRVLVVFAEEKTPSTATEGKIDVNEGQTVALDGVVNKMPVADEARRQFGKLINESEFNNFASQKVYIFSENPRIVKR